jgi:hypothetical protein
MSLANVVSSPIDRADSMYGFAISRLFRWLELDLTYFFSHNTMQSASRTTSYFVSRSKDKHMKEAGNPADPN